MADMQAAAEIIRWTLNIITLILMIVAISASIKKKNNICFAVAIFGNLLVYYFTQSPLLCWIVSIACIIWASRTKLETEEQTSTKSKAVKAVQSAQDANKPKKIGNIIGVVIGVGFIVGPLIGYFNQDASLKDPTTQGILILFAVIGGFMVMNNIFKLAEKDASTQTVSSSTVKNSSKKAESEDDSDSSPKIRCRFCKKQYSSEYNGCPYCKKK